MTVIACHNITSVLTFVRRVVLRVDVDANDDGHNETVNGNDTSHDDCDKVIR